MWRLRGLSNLARRYDGFIVDLWGVVHDGVAPYPGALDCLEQLSEKRVMLLSNAPRRAAAARDALRGLGIEDRLYSGLLTSGEATWLALRGRRDPWYAALGSRVYHLGPVRDRGIIEGLDLAQVQEPAAADFVLNTGPDDQRDGASLDAFLPELEACQQCRLPMICANPDLAVVRGGLRILCAGALAAVYEELGGEVRYVGKPDAAIYDQALDAMGLSRNQVVVVGDSLHTDMAGARAAGIDGVWVLGGLHAASHEGDWDRAEAEAARTGLYPFAGVPSLVW